MSVRGVGTAYTYAWWLTGDDDAAAAAVRTAVQQTSNGDELALLRAVRAAAPDAAMFPASELALLHDICGVELGTAATLVGIPRQEAAATLAQGRLEALADNASVDIVHRERLGGLAVRKPADIAHARRCRSCGEISDRIQRGREELLSIAPVAPPDDLLRDEEPEDATAAPPAPLEEPAAEDQPAVAPPAETVTPVEPAEDVATAEEPAAPPAPAPPEEPAAEPAVAQPAETVTPSERADRLREPVEARAPTDAVAAEEPIEELEPVEEPEPEEEYEPRRRGGPPAQLVLIAVGAVVLLAAVLIWLFMDTQPDPQVEQPVVETPGPSPVVTGPQTEPQTEPPATAPTTASTATPTAPATSAPTTAPTGGFAVTAVGVVSGESDTPAPPGATVSADEPLRFAVDFRGAASGVLLEGDWSVDGEPFKKLSVLLARNEGTHGFGEPIPDDGWPPGQHQVVFSVDGSVVASIDFTVA